MIGNLLIVHQPGSKKSLSAGCKSCQDVSGSRLWHRTPRKPPWPQNSTGGHKERILLHHAGFLAILHLML